jgi:hypothetical protein
MRVKTGNTFQISEKYRLDSDKYNIILQEKQIVKGERGRELSVSKVGDTYWLNIAYFSTPKNALHYIIENEIKEFWVEDLKEVVKKMGELHKMVLKLELKDAPTVERSTL